MPAATLKVFISSPGDVGQERLLAARVLERLQGEFASFVELQPILWEHEPLRATSHFQEQILPPSQTDIVVCILWSRLGTRLPEQFRREDGSLYSSGTEWEFEDAARAHRERGKPHLLVYRKTAEALIGLNDHQAILDRLEQKKALDRFIDQWFGNPTASFKAAFHAVQTPDHFEELLETHLSHLIRSELPQYATDEGEPSVPIRWHKGSPFRGLAAFDYEHAPVFFGRTRAIGDLKNALLTQAANGCAFVVVFGMSGGGKSSMVRAGLLPTLTQPGIIEGIGLWRWCAFRPSDAAGDLFDGLAAALLSETALPELETAGLDAAELAALFREAPQRAIAPLKMSLKRAAEVVAQQERLHEIPEARLAVMIDQMEELFTRDGITEAQRAAFVAVISTLARSGIVWVIATMRSDFYPRCGEIPELLTMKEGAGQYDLVPPTFAEIGQMIRHPARAAGLRFEVNPATRERLDDVLHEAAARHPEALPLLEFALDELFQQRTDTSVLTFAAYEQLGGLEGALARRAEEVLTSLKPSVQAALPALLRSLVTVGHAGNDLVASRRVPVAQLAADGDRNTLLDALVAARLLVTDRADDGQPVVGIAHEALLRHWPRVQKWLEEDRDFLRARDRVAAAAHTWREEGKRPDFLLQVGKPLAEADDLLARRRSDLEASVVEFIEASRARAAQARRRKTFTLAGAAACLFVFALFSFYQWQQVAGARKRAVKAVARLTEVNIPEKLHGVDKESSVPILKALYEATLATVNEMPDTDDTRTAKTVSLQLLSDMQLQQGDPTKALATCDQALALGTELAKRHPDPENQRNLAVYYVTRGNILEALDRYDEALTAYEQARTHAEGGANKRDLWYIYMLEADLQLRQQPADALRQKQYEAVLAACAKGLQLAEDRARTEKDVRSQSDVAFSDDKMGQALEEQGNWYAETGKPADARRCWTDALKNLQKSQEVIGRLARENGDAQAIRNLPRITQAVAGMQRKLGSTPGGRQF